MNCQSRRLSQNAARPKLRGVGTDAGPIPGTRPMSRIAIPAPEAVPAASQPVLGAVAQQLGRVPNLFRLVALSPAALQGYTAFSAALGKALDLKTRERIALAVAEVNGCGYCLSAHTYLGQNLAKLSEAETALNRRGVSSDARAGAAMRFAVQVAKARGKVADADIAAVRAAGYSDAQIVEIVAVVAENVLTNLMNNVADTDIDFPVVAVAAAA
jgi:uncharacterized peroxidase-related enzyme